ncbi:MAG: hypothetical protein Q4G22_13480 [Paracoccus sp. (in: a-proteobacteria)]|nr:hypothetical protein [Paracoccus sp. (in: a-proteobacteria)]MDO5632829.1 hypothetical protein [Paracoccus sp. (in: a-proteobacteria)]
MAGTKLAVTADNDFGSIGASGARQPTPGLLPMVPFGPPQLRTTA